MFAEWLLINWYRRFPPSIPPSYSEVLLKYSPYFRKLNHKNKDKFLFRLFILLKLTTFKPSRLERVTDEMKVLIGSAIIQITFGFRHFVYRHFNTIEVAPRPYTYRGREQELFLGDANFRTKIISLSWPHVVQGFVVEEDAINVALHEVAHCLKYENKFRDLSSRFMDTQSLIDWHEQAMRKMEILRKKEQLLLRDYAAQNYAEFFSVSVETFFERPEDFRKLLPALYTSLSKLLNQDPCNQSDPVIPK